MLGLGYTSSGAFRILGEASIVKRPESGGVALSEGSYPELDKETNCVSRR
jgi:hypothetical protein